MLLCTRSSQGSLCCSGQRATRARDSVVAVVVTFAWCVLVVLVLFWAQAVLVPIALAILLTFLLAPPVTWLQRWVGRIPAVLAMVTLVFTLLGLAGWGLARQMDNLAQDLPRYRVNILQKIADVRGAGKGGRSRNCKRRSTRSRPTWENRTCPWNALAARRGDFRAGRRFLGLRVARSDGRPAGHGRTRAGDGHLHAARTPGSPRPADRADRARPARRSRRRRSTRRALASAGSC